MGLFKGLFLVQVTLFFHSIRDRKPVLISVCETHLQFTRETVDIEGKHTSAHANPQQQKMHAAVFVSVDTGAESLPEMEGGKMCRGKDREKV